MKNEIRWITLWMFMSSTMILLSLIYFYLNQELGKYALMIAGITLFTIVLPYCIWKYKQIKFVEKRSIVIQILND